MIFRFFFWKTANKKIFFRVLTLPLSMVRRASVDSQWRLGLPVCASSVSGRNSKAPYLHTALKIWRPQPCCVGVQHGLPGRGRGEGDHQTQAFAPPSFPLSSHHTHTHTDIQGCQLLRFRRSMPRSVLACYTHTKNATVIYISAGFRCCCFFSRPSAFLKMIFRFYEKSPKRRITGIRHRHCGESCKQ